MRQLKRQSASLMGALCVASLAHAAPPADEAELARKRGCLNCHAVDAAGEGGKVGPYFSDVAQRYAGQPQAIESVAERVQLGSKGLWLNKGVQVPMPRNPQVTQEEARRLVAWILGLK
ncbi:MAG: c-type cytochrome [Rhodocyclaceae bacterium]|nr:c-type cytochrome [Rhodocyclaceae bacterium]